MTELITIAGQYLIIVVGLIAVVATIFSEKTVRWSIIKLVILSFGLAFLIAYIAGMLYYDTRPFVVENIQPLIPHLPDNGFPSDHTLAATVTAAVIFVYRRKLGILLGVLGILVGVARIAAHLHYPIDVVASILIAVIATFCAWLTLKKFDRRFKSSP
ncbi:MAG: phosphatase PAP2 family protein [Dehalococcoidales bacterium]